MSSHHQVEKDRINSPRNFAKSARYFHLAFLFQVPRGETKRTTTTHSPQVQRWSRGPKSGSKFAVIRGAAYPTDTGPLSPALPAAPPLQSGLVRDGHIPDKPGRTPHIGIIALVPVDKALPQRDAGYGCPTAAQAHVVLVVEEVGRIPWVQVHGLETLVPSERSARPLPEPAEVGLAA